MIVNVFHNVTTDEDGRLAIFARFGDEPRIKPGDELQLVGVLDLPDAGKHPIHAADFVYQIGNVPYGSSYTKTYRSWGVRSLSAGDVLAIEQGEGDKIAVDTYGCEPVGWTPMDLGQFKLTGAVIISLHVENAYELYEDVEVTVTDVVVPAPPADTESDDYEKWARHQIINRYTGAGHIDGDSWYDVLITASSDPALVGRTFEWGY